MLNNIHKPSDIKKLSIEELNTLAQEIKLFLIESIEKTGGHLSSNLGTIELTLAMHYVVETSNDTVVWDVEHQAYTHKVVTGRKELMATLLYFYSQTAANKRKYGEVGAVMCIRERRE